MWRWRFAPRALREELFIDRYEAASDDHPGLSPLHYGYGYDPIANGMQWGSLLALAVGAAVFVAAAVVLFERRDLRS